MTVTMGIWCGTLVSGTFGTHDFQAAGTVGYGVRRCHELQKYAVPGGCLAMRQRDECHSNWFFELNFLRFFYIFIAFLFECRH